MARNVNMDYSRFIGTPAQIAEFMGLVKADTSVNVSAAYSDYVLLKEPLTTDKVAEAVGHLPAKRAGT